MHVFFYYSKAFDTVSHNKLLEILSKVDIDDNDKMVLTNLYWQQKTRIRYESEMTDNVDIKKGIRQGCVLSPLLFNINKEFFLDRLNHYSV